MHLRLNASVAVVGFGVSICLNSASLARERELMSPTVFAVLMRMQAAEEGLSLSSKTDCGSPGWPCKFLELPRTIEIWIRPNKANEVESFQINFDGTQGVPATVLDTAQRLCTIGITVLAAKRASPSILNTAFKGAHALGRWSGTVAGYDASVRIDTKYPFGACEISVKQTR